MVPLSPVVHHRPAWLGDLPGTCPCHPGAVLPCTRRIGHPGAVVRPLAPGGCPLIAAAATLHLGHPQLDLVGDNVPFSQSMLPVFWLGWSTTSARGGPASSMASWRFSCSSTGWWPRGRSEFVSWWFPVVSGGSQETLWRLTLSSGLIILCWFLSSYRPDKGKDHHGVSSGWSSVWHRSNTGLSSTQYEQIPIILGIWPFWLTPFFFRSIKFWRAYG